jgi:hypothetical protein
LTYFQSDQPNTGLVPRCVLPSFSPRRGLLPCSIFNTTSPPSSDSLDLQRRLSSPGRHRGSAPAVHRPPPTTSSIPRKSSPEFPHYCRPKPQNSNLIERSITTAPINLPSERGGSIPTARLTTGLHHHRDHGHGPLDLDTCAFGQLS